MSEKKNQQRFARFDFRPLEKPMKLDNGFIKTPVFATRSGVFKYVQADGTVVREFRPPEQVFSKESLDTLAGVPVTNRHPTELVDAQNAKKFMVGFTSDIVEKHDNFVKTSATITDQSMIQEVETGGLREVSCGYTCDLEFTSGRTDTGEEFDAIQRNIRYNHLAIVDRGRAGPEVRLRMDSNSAILDENDNFSAPRADNSHAKTEKGDEMATVEIEGQNFEMSEDLAKAVRRLLKKAVGKGEDSKDKKSDELKDLERQTILLEGEKEKLQAKVDSLTEENKELKESKLDDKQIHERVIARTNLIETAKEVLDEETKLDEMSDSEIRKAVVAKKCPALKLDEKTDVYVEARFDHIAESLKTERKDGNKDLKEALGSKAGKADEDDNDAEKARQKSMKSDSEAWQSPIGFHLAN